MQYCTQGGARGLKKINQHLFHFPLKIELNRSNEIKLSFSDIDKPYSDFFFLNGVVTIEKTGLSNIIDRFEQAVEEKGSSYFFDNRFKELIKKSLQQISNFSTFEDTIEKPISDHCQENYLKISFSPAINIKRKKPRFFEKLTEGILEYKEKNKVKAELFNLLIRDPEIEHTNSFPKRNYFIDDLFEKYKEDNPNLNRDQDFSAFFPLPYNKEQKQIYENYLKNRLTVVTGPPGTGKSHTIVNILCSLLAQGKRVLVTAQTDKALESLLDKVPSNFDDLIFTKIQLENNKERFSLETSIDNISNILGKNSHSEVESEITELNLLKGEYINLKTKISQVLEKEYEKISLNDSFKDLRSYQLNEKLIQKEKKEWDWIKDPLSLKNGEDFENFIENIHKYKDLADFEDSNLNKAQVDLQEIQKKLEEINFQKYLSNKDRVLQLHEQLNIDEKNKNRLLKLNLNEIENFAGKYNNSDILVRDFSTIRKLFHQAGRCSVTGDDLSANLPFSELVRKADKFINDISTYLAQIKKGKDKVGTWDKLFNSRYKKVKYLEDIVLNRNHCDDKLILESFEGYLKELKVIDNILQQIKKAGFITSIDEDPSLLSKKNLVNKSVEKIESNFSLIKELDNPRSEVVKFAEILGIDVLDVETIHNKIGLTREKIESLREYDKETRIQAFELKEISKKLKTPGLNNAFISYLPLERISNEEFLEFWKTLSQISSDIEKERIFGLSKAYLKKELPETIDVLQDVLSNYITKESFEFAQVNQYLENNQIIDLQQKKEELNQINDRIFRAKSKILFDLAKSNFKDNFDKNEIDKFINLLHEFKSNLHQAKRGIKDKVRYQILARKNSIKISDKLSCWVMKFNDVLDSVGEKPEIFDCIIVDEASQLDFNSLILGYYAKNLIVVGDDKQTSPSSLTGADGDSFDSIKNQYLEYLGDNRIQIRSDNSLFTLAGMIAGRANSSLVEHFRCMPEIIEFSKSEYYSGSLRPLKQINADRLVPLKPVLVKEAYVEEKIVGKEIVAIKEYLMKILSDQKYKNKTIGVVSLGTTKHTEKLKDVKEDLSVKFGRDLLDEHKFIIEDAPKFQGDERDVMIISLGVALDYKKIQQNGNAKPHAIVKSPDDHQKINVALSRAKEQMILFHSVTSNDLREHDFRRKILSFFYDEKPKIDSFDLPEDISLRNRNNVPDPFDSWFEYDIAKELKRKDYHYLQPQYKVKEDEQFFNVHRNAMSYVNFKLDIVVFNNNKMVAIECDGDPYHSLPEDVAHDTERQEFLERVGWKVYRILYSAYKRNRSLEIDKLVDFIERNTIIDYPLQGREVDGMSQRVNGNSTSSVETVNNVQNILQPYSDQQISAPETTGITGGNNNLNSRYKYKSIIDNLQEQTIPNSQTTLFNDKSSHEITPTYGTDFSVEQIDNSTSENDDAIRYFNFFKNGKYSIDRTKNSSAEYKLAISEPYYNGELLMFYDNGKINKVRTQSFIHRLDRVPINGKNNNQNLIKLHCIKSEMIFAICYTKNHKKFFKAHLTSKLKPDNINLRLEGKKVLYDQFEMIEYKILPLRIKNELGTLIMQSLQSIGKPLSNKNYQKQWKVIGAFWPEIFQ